MNILIASMAFPYPPNKGGVYDVYGRILQLKELGHKIDLIYTEKTDVSIDRLEHLSKIVDNQFFIKRENKLIDFFSLNPLQALSRLGFERYLLKKQYDLVIVEGDYSSSILDNPNLKANYRILRNHNNESQYYLSLFKSATSLKEKIYFLTESFKFHRYSAKVFNRYNSIWFISNEELKKKKQKINKSVNAIFVPPPFAHVKQSGSHKKEGLSALYVGDLDVSNNLESIIWYLKNVHQKVFDQIPDYKFYLVGKISDTSKEELNSYIENTPSILFHPNVDNLEEFYSKCTLFINPIRRGAGVKIKSIDALAHNLPLITTKIGIEGLPQNESLPFVIADNEGNFAKSIVEVLSNKSKLSELEKNIPIFLNCINSKRIIKKELERINEFR